MKIVIIFLLIFLPIIGLASGVYTWNNQNICYEGFVPCGKKVCLGSNLQNGKCVPCSQTAFINCEFCHLFIMLDDILDFLLLRIIPILATIMLIIGGIMLYFAGASAEAFSTGKNILTSAVIGLVIIYCSWLIVNTILNILGIAEWTGLKSWWEFSCK